MNAPRGTRVLMANEPRAYREAIAEAIRRIRPAVVVEVVRPEDLEETLVPFDPDVVICSTAPESVRARVPIWVELYPDHEDRSVVGAAGKTRQAGGMQLDGLLAIVDQASTLTQQD